MLETVVNQVKVTITAKQAAQYIGCSYWSLCEMCKRGEVPFISVGKKRLFREEALLRWITEREQQSTVPRAA
ncbi:MAG: Helix-turn-helix domain protein [bacterium ADurb.Bin243]|nr:MAG: Helix-turn-helix domain protein [bacterium ADurb.Bin243]